MTVSLSDIVTYKRLVAVGGPNEFWYEDLSVAGTMIELADLSGLFDVTDQLMMFEGYQKVFIVNGANLYVADFINTRLDHTALATSHAKGDILTQAVSTAQMVVDFTNTAKTSTYGYVTSGTFNTTNLVSGNGSGTAFTPTTVDAKPHGYAWTVYPDGASGSMPVKAYIGCLYRGRCVLSGNPNYPYQWYMSRQADPWDWVYVANDAQSPVAGGNADAGELGDIVRALIPYKDEYLIFGCANSIWVMKGDPAEGGVLQEVDLTKGIFGFGSWCYDADGNLYFASHDGIYMLPNGFGPIADLSGLVLPNMFDDLSVQPDTHRISLGYDKSHDGIFIAITTLADGTCNAFFYDLKTKGFFPETYPTTCGIYSLVQYDAVDKDYSGLLFGSTDGYIRVHSDTTKNDTTTASTQAISANIVLPIIQSEDGNNKTKLISESITLAGGASGGTYSDSDGATIEIYTADDPETVIEDIKDGATPLHTTTISGTGKATRMRNRAVGNAIAINVKNTTASQTFSIERLAAEIQEVNKY
jgi:hypothetical protein